MKNANLGQYPLPNVVTSLQKDSAPIQGTDYGSLLQRKDIEGIKEIPNIVSLYSPKAFFQFLVSR
jgi:hypothetical protein